MKYAFMSFSSEQSTFEELIALAKAHGYDGIEIRLDAKHAHGIETTSDDAFIANARKLAQDSGIAVCCVATSCMFQTPEKSAQGVESGKAAIKLAMKLGAPTIRVFGGTIPEGMPRAESLKTVIAGLKTLAPFAEAAGVTVCVETHDSWCDPAHVAEIIAAVGSPYVMVNWDIMHPVLTAGVSIEKSFETLKPYIKHVHIHGGTRENGKLEFLPIGQGPIDHRAAVKLLMAAGYQGFLSGEWIGWEPAEVHLPREVAVMRAYEKEA